LIGAFACALACSGKMATISTVVMRGHGATVVGSSIREAVYRSIYAAENAWLQMEAMRLGKVTYLALEEARLGLHINNTSTDRPWAIWSHEVHNRTK
jgi:ribulose-5-phosphate 4-epimerase/fuculose-1-phosphate aldolase